MGTGYCITTKCFALKCEHPEWLGYTQDVYNKVLHFYYQLLLDNRELLKTGSQQCLRALEKRSIVGREKLPVSEPLPFAVPLYLRRAAINAAIAMVKSLNNRSGFVNQAASFNASVVCYKGMYKDLSNSSICIKAYDGCRWKWMNCRIWGNELTETMEALSPSIIIKQASYCLHIPVKEKVADIRKAKERMADEDNICSVQFTNTDMFAVACIMNGRMEQKAVRFFKGGKEYKHRGNVTMEKIRKSAKARGDTKVDGERTNKRYWMYLKHLSDCNAHQISKELVDFCVEYEVSAIVVAKSYDELSKPVLKSVGNWAPLHLSTRIKEYLGYKAWKAGIIILEVQPKDAAKTCSLCGAPIKKKEGQFYCEQGHNGNRYLNTARNLGKICIKDFRAKRMLLK